MLENLLALPTAVKAGGALIAAGLAWWRGRAVKDAVKRVTRLYQTVEAARSESSPGGRSYTQAEVEQIVDEAGKAVVALAPLIGRLAGAKKE